MKKIISILMIGILIISGLGASASFEKDRNSISPGDYFRFLKNDGRIRSYRMHIPPGYDGEKPVPLVLVLHGAGTLCNSYVAQKVYNFDSKADEEGFITIYPNGERMHRWYLFNVPFPLFELWELMTWSRTWNFWDYNNVDDVGFIHNLITNLQSSLNINTSRIYVAGHSGGAMMAHRLGTEITDIAAIAPVSGSIGGTWINGYEYTIPDPLNPLPVIIIHGVKDEAVPYYGGWINLTYLFRTSYGYMKSVNESVAFWVYHNQCEPEPLITASSTGRVEIRTYVNGTDGAEVVLYSYLDGDHGWNPTSELSVNDIIWDFFERHPKR